MRFKPYGLTFRGKTRFFRSLWAGRRCAAASRFTFFKVETLQHQGTAFLHALRREPLSPTNVRKNNSSVRRLSASTDARQGLALRPPPDAAMARARRRSRTPEGRTERRSRRGHHPGHRPGKVRADAPRDTRQTRFSPIKETAFALPQKGEYGGAGGVEGNFPLSPHAPRRAGDPPPMPGSSRNAQRNTGSIRPERVTFFKSNTLWLE